MKALKHEICQNINIGLRNNISGVYIYLSVN